MMKRIALLCVVIAIAASTLASAGPKVFRRDTSARSFVVRTIGELQNALTAPNDTMIFVESIMDAYDALAPIINSSNKGADLDYGPRGPQRRDNLQLRAGSLAI